MKISDLTCPHCGALYLLAESATTTESWRENGAGGEDCRVCGQVLASWSDGRLRALRLMASPALRRAARPWRSPGLSPSSTSCPS